MKLTPQQVNNICKGDEEIAGYFHDITRNYRSSKPNESRN